MKEILNGIFSKFSDTSLCNVFLPKALSMKCVAMRYISLQNRWAAELDEAVETAMFN
jgi:hypothetical protein